MASNNVTNANSYNTLILNLADEDGAGRPLRFVSGGSIDIAHRNVAESTGSSSSSVLAATTCEGEIEVDPIIAKKLNEFFQKNRNGLSIGTAVHRTVLSLNANDPTKQSFFESYFSICVIEKVSLPALSEIGGTTSLMISFSLNGWDKTVSGEQ